MSRAADLLWYARIFGDATGMVRRPLNSERGRALVRRLMETREKRFLAFAARYIYGYARSPYGPLLRLAGCEYGDLAAMVRQKGLEQTLETLREEGVHLSFEEFKGRRDAVRRGRTFRFSERDFDNPFIAAHLEHRSGGTRSHGSAVHLGMKYVAENYAPAFHLALAALDATGLPLAVWTAGVSVVQGPLALLHAGSSPSRWFNMHDPDEPAASPRQRLLTILVKMAARPWGAQIPSPEYTPVSAVDRVLAYLLDLRRRHGRCALLASPSATVRLAALARQRGETLSGVSVVTGSEPLTPGKAAEIRSSGARPGSFYIFAEGGAVGAPCGAGGAPDDMHFLAMNMALIPHRRTIPEAGDLNSFMFTSLSTLPPKILLNVESDDFGEFTRRRCGCPLDELGLHDHLAFVRSFTKLTGEGSTILGTDCVRIVEEVLPREFGGRSIDYQLLEAEDEEHLTRLFLLVSPEVGPVDEQRVRDRFVEELRDRTAQGLRLWRQAETIRVVRREPVATPRGKILPFHTQALAAFLGAGASAPPAVPEGTVPERAVAESGIHSAR